MSKCCVLIDYEVELESARLAILKWHRFHPMGAITLEEKDELQQLKYMHIGLIAAKTGDTGDPFPPGFFEESEGEDWQQN